MRSRQIYIKKKDTECVGLLYMQFIESKSPTIERVEVIKKNSLAFHVFLGKNLDFSLLKQQPIEK